MTPESKSNAPEKRAFADFFADLPDPRLDRKKRHKLMDIFAITLAAVLTGAKTWVEIAQFGEVRLDWLRQRMRLTLENGVPSHDTFGRVFRRVDPVEFQRRFLAWMKAVCRHAKLVAIDGKTLCQSVDPADGKAAIHLVSAWAVENRLVLGQCKTDAKSNEITAIPELLNLLDVAGCLVTIDAMGCQKKIARQITSSGGDYLLGLKGNQETLSQDVERFFHCAERDRFALLRHDSLQTTEKGHGRIETREYWIVDENSFDAGGEWGGLKSVGMVRSERRLKGAVETEVRYYIGSREKMTAAEFAAAARGHWGIENSLHWSLDVIFREDDCRVRKDHAAENFAVARRIALNLLREEKTICKVGLQAKQHRCALDEAYLATVLGF